MAQICYYGDRLSPNMAKTPEGFLICKNVPIARTGYQEYLESELIEDGDPNEYVSVFRSPKEVFSKATLASFEGKPVTNGHPTVDVSTRNYRGLAKGHVQHVRMGTGNDSDKIVADLYITDPDLIEEIRNGKRQVSAGYYALDVKDKYGRVCQTKIRGNHVAVVNEGRAGSAVCIRDNKPQIGGSMDNRKVKIARLVARYLRDAAPDEIEERMKDAAEALEEELDNGSGDVDVEVKEDACKDACKDEEPEEMKADGDDVMSRLAAIEDRIAALESRFADEEPKADADGDDADFAEADVKVEDEDGDMPDDDIPDDDEEDLALDEDEGDAVSAKDSAIRRIAMASRGIKDAKDRKRVQDAILKSCKGKSQMKGLMEVTKKNKARRDASASKVIDVEKQQAIYDKLNPHKGGK